MDGIPARAVLGGGVTRRSLRLDQMRRLARGLDRIR